MSFISYAQNYEDVMLYRALKGVERGFYIDVGAMDPLVDSVTKAFYERGWRGINIEPVRHWFERLEADRPEDINLNVAISDKNGFSQIFDLPETGLSTYNKDLAKDHLIKHGFQSKAVMVPTMTLDEVIKKASHQEIHFLKIDVEGAEKKVLASINLKISHPWIILVEATKPDSQEQNYETWEYLLTEAGYKFVYFDGLNRFYVQKERDDLASVLSTPPNVFDSFVRASEWNYQTALKIEETKNQQLELILNAKEAERQGLESGLKAREAERIQLEQALNAKELEWQAQEAALNTKEVERQQLFVVLTAKEADKQRLEAALKTEEAAFQKLDLSLNAVTVERQGLETTLKTMEAERQQLESSLNAKEIERQELESKLADRQAELQQLEAALKFKETERVELETGLKAREADRQRLETTLAASKIELSQLTDGLEREKTQRLKLEADQFGLESALKARDVELKDLVSDVTAKESERQQLDAALKVSEAGRLALATTLAAKEGDLQRMESVVIDKKNENGQLKAELKGEKTRQLRLVADLQALENALNAKEISLQRLQSALDAKEAEQRGLEASLVSKQQLEVVLNAKEADRVRLEARLQELANAVKVQDAQRLGLESRRQQMQVVLNAREAERQRLETFLQHAKETWPQQWEVALNAKEATRQQVQAALETKNAELESIRLNRDQVFAELMRVYESRSFKLTRPFRLIFITARGWRDTLTHRQAEPETAATYKPADTKMILREMVDGLRKVSWIAILLDKIKRRFPRFWYKAARQIKEALPVRPISRVPFLPVGSGSLSTPDEKYFLKFLERELSVRQAMNMETK
jgi:FkbM family methyltransferase